MEKTPPDLLHEMIGFAAARLMEGGLTGAAWSENGPERLKQRNGYRESGHGRRSRVQALYASEAAEKQLGLVAEARRLAREGTSSA